MNQGDVIKKGDIVIKDIAVLRGLMERNFAPLLITIICTIALRFGVLITESWREKKHHGDLHSVQPVRANDLRCWCYETEQLAYEIMHWINTRWIYDPKRIDMLVAKIHDSGQGKHFHIQVHENTRLDNA